MCVQVDFTPKEGPAPSGQYHSQFFVPIKRVIQDAALHNQWYDFECIGKDASQKVVSKSVISVKFTTFGHEESSFSADGARKEYYPDDDIALDLLIEKQKEVEFKYSIKTGKPQRSIVQSMLGERMNPYFTQ